MVRSIDTWHLAGNEDEAKVADFELQLWRAFYGLQRWQEECEKNANKTLLSSNEIAILHIIRMKNSPKTLTDIERLLNRHDTHNIRYSINKLLKMELIKKTQSVYSGKNYYFEITEAGEKNTDNYSRVRQFILIKMFEESGMDLEELTKNLTKVKAIYDEADRTVAQNLVKTQNSARSLHYSDKEPPVGQILLVEDDASTAKLTQAILSDFHYQVDIARNGEEALELSRAHHYDIIFMDIELSDMSGRVVTQKIRSQEQTANHHTPIIGLTANVSHKNKQKCIEAGMNAVSMKPLVKDKVEDIVSMFISKQNDFNDNPPEPNSPNRPLLKIIDLDLGTKLLGGDRNLAKEAITMLINSFAEEVSILEEACKSLNFDKMQAILHKLRGGISYCGVPRFKEACIRFDDYLKTGKTELILELHHNLIQEFNALKQRDNDLN